MLQTLEELPEGVLAHVLSASELACTELLSQLPAKLHGTALRAKYPSVLANRGVEVSRRDIWLCQEQWGTFWGLLTTLPHLRSLTIVEQYKRGREMFVPLEGFTALTALTVNGICPRFLPESSQRNNCRLEAGRLPDLVRLDFDDAQAEYTDASVEPYHSNEVLQTCFESGSPRTDQPLIFLLQCQTSLQYLNLHSIQLLEVETMQLSRCMPQLTCLQHIELELRCDNATHMSWLSHMVQLTYVTFSARTEEPGEEAISQILPHLKQLQHVKLPWCYDHEHIVQQLAALRDLRHVEFHVDTYGRVPRLITLSQVTFLSLSFSEMESDVIKALGREIAALPALQVLQIRPDYLDEGSVQPLLSHSAAISAQLRIEPEIAVIDSGMSVLSSMFSVLSQQLHHISLHTTQGVLDSLQCTEAFCSGLSKLTKLTYLQLCSFKRFSNLHVAEVLSQSLAKLSCLKKLSLSHNKLGGNALHALAESFVFLTSLEYLNLECNRIRNRDVVVIAPHLSYMSGLQELILSDSCICEEGFKRLAQTLCSLEELQQLHLAGCVIDRETVPYLLELLANNRALEHVNLRNVHFRFTDESVTCISDSTITHRFTYTAMPDNGRWNANFRATWDSSSDAESV